jgi:hypothetical protein
VRVFTTSPVVENGLQGGITAPAATLLALKIVLPAPSLSIQAQVALVGITSIPVIVNTLVSETNLLSLAVSASIGFMRELFAIVYNFLFIYDFSL